MAKGQLWYDTAGTGDDSRIVRVNDDGTGQTTIVDNNPQSFPTSFPADIGLDTARGFYFAIFNNGFLAQNATLVRGSLAGGAPTTLVNYAVTGTTGSTFTTANSIVSALYVDPIARRIFVGVQDPAGVDSTKSGIRSYSYDDSGTLTDNGFVVTQASSGKGLEVGARLLDANDFAFDRATGNLYFTETGSGGPGYTGLFRVNITNPGVATQVVAQSQFPDSGVNGYLRDVEVDTARGRVFFSTYSQSPSDSSSGYDPNDNGIWVTALNGAGNQIAARVTLNGAPSNLYPDDLAFDAVNNILYVETAGTNASNTDDVILVFQLSADGLSGNLIRTITPATPDSIINIGGLAYNALPIFAATAGAGYVEGAAAAAIYGSVSVTDADSVLRGASVQITGNFDSATDSLVFTNQNGITGSYNNGTGTLTLSGYATAAQYQAALRSVRFAASGDNPSTATRTFTTTLDDGSPAVPAGSSNVGSSTLAVTLVNDAPVLGGAGNTAPYTERTAPVQATNTITIGDVDSTNLVGATVTIGSVVSGDFLTFFTQNNITGLYSGATGVLTLSGSASLAAYQAALRSITFTSLSNDPTVGGTRTSRTLSFVVDDGGSANRTSNTVTTTVAITAVDNLPVAVTDTATTAEHASISGTIAGLSDLLRNDTDVDGGPKAITLVNGVAANVGTTVTLASGARVTVQSNGEYVYNPNGAFNFLVASNSGTGGQSSATDFFTYTLNGGSTTLVTVTITGVTNAGDQIRGGTGNDTLTGTTGADYFDISQGGNDTVTSADGDDLIFVGSNLSAATSINGGVGYDQVGLRGSLTQSLGNVTNTEYLAVLSGTSTRFGGDGSARYTYNLTTTDATVAAGVTYTVQANELVAGENLRFDGSAETNGSFRIYAGKGIDTLIGGAGDDGFFFGEGRRFTVADQIDGGAGNDQVGLRGANGGSNVFTATTMVNVETLVLLSATNSNSPEAGGYFYEFTLHDATVAAGQTLTINGAQLRGGELITIDGRAETNGSFVFIGGLDTDTFYGGAGADVFYGGGSADTLFGGGGNDIFRFGAVSDSRPGTNDWIRDFQVGDQIDVSMIDAISGTPADDMFTFIGTAAFSNVSGQMRAFFNAGTGYWIAQGDIDGNGVADFELRITSDHPIVAADFIL